MVKRLVLVVSIATAIVAACGRDDETPPAPPAPAYPEGPYEVALHGTVPPGMTFEGLDGPVNLDSLYEPNAVTPRLAVIRTSTAWCGTCVWHASHTRRLLENPRIKLVDLLVADADNAPADREALLDWKAKIDAPQAIGIDLHFSFAPALLVRAALPEYVFVDTRTMKILRTASNPDPVDLRARIDLSLAEMDEREPPAAPAPVVDEDGFTEDQVDLIRAMKLDGSFAPPADPTNAVGDDPAAIALGKVLFKDVKLSPSGTVSCATCHDEGLELGDAKPVSEGVGVVDRNSPNIALSSHARWQFWDGRADTLWSQALGPFEDAREYGGSRLYVAHEIANRYATEYDALFGSDPRVVDALPPNGKPGEPAYDALSDADKDRVTRIFVNVGKAIAAFERAIRVQPNKLDAYAGGDRTALTPGEKESLRVFFVTGCAQCHYGPRLTDDAFHNLRFPTGRQDRAADPGRADGLVRLAASEFLASSKWSDSPASAKRFKVNPALVGAFKTPTLRGLPMSAPFGHGGTFNTLADVSAHYSIRGLRDVDPRAAGRVEDWVPQFDQVATGRMPSFLEVLTAPIVMPP